ncbi:flagellar assembly peptidoglycan hydrolase FlgJ [Lysobacter arvi]|uniref:Peptidoglycan hydrolase FlgJ n=1 Tax=Lysobacter arvi TaxID=3038776 RepID=A0ABU1CCP6_9GAMM|nr:flagellar assembly peptidoglycan hydrolase FlgJ [Lysobacter arvi]MDR0182952.1 flagellar assembly peptidoglycan hydrolase FlgJ [Lysobacter arvi]
MHLRPTTAQPLSTTDAPRADRSRVEYAAQQLEAQFAQMLVKSMRSASFGDPLMGNNSTYRDMYDQQLSRELAKGRGLGLAPMIVQQLTRSTGGADASVAPQGGFPLGPGASAMSLPLTPSSDGVSLPGLAAPALPRLAPAPVECDPNAKLDCSSPEAFVRSVWPHAQRTAQELGVDPKALVAQAALETGWGRRLASGGGEATSHNLFGIKAGSKWSGQRVNAGTHEYVNGQRVSERADFRAYGSIGESFADYAKLLNQPRYAQARAAGGDTRQFAQALQKAGYATDPAYAAKINAIAEGATLNRALAALDGPNRG